MKFKRRVSLIAATLSSLHSFFSAFTFRTNANNVSSPWQMLSNILRELFALRKAKKWPLLTSSLLKYDKLPRNRIANFYIFMKNSKMHSVHVIKDIVALVLNSSNCISQRWKFCLGSNEYSVLLAPNSA